MTRYVILIAYRPGSWMQASPEEQDHYVTAHQAFERYVDQHGERLGSAALADADNATTVRREDAGVSISDGPFAETVEMIGGYYDVDLPDLDHAIAAARLLPSAYTLEIRPTVSVSV